MATEDNEILRNRIPIAVRDETYNTVRDVEDKVRLENELYLRQRAYTEYMEKHPEAVEAEINRINAELQHDLNLLYSRYGGDPLYNKLAEDRKLVARELIENLPGYNVWANLKYGPNGAVLKSAPENYGLNYNLMSPEQERLNRNAIDFSRLAFSNIGSGAYYLDVDPRNQDAVNSYVSNAAVLANIINDAQAATGALGLVRGIPGAVSLFRGAAPRIGSGLGRGAGYALEAVTPSTYLKPAARFFTSNPATVNTIGGLGDAAAASYFLTHAATDFYNNPSVENGAWLGLSSIPFFRPVKNMVGATGNFFSRTPVRVGRFNIGETPTVGLQVGEYGVGYPLNRAASNPIPIGGRVSGPLLPARVSPSLVTPVTSAVTNTGTGVKGTGRLNGNKVTIDGKEYVIEVNPDGTAVLTGNDGTLSIIRVTPPKTGARGSGRGSNYLNVALDVEYEIIDDSYGMLTGGNSGVPQTVPGSGANVDEGQLFLYIDNSGKRNIGPYSKIMLIAEREGNPYAVNRYTDATETSAGMDVSTGALRGNGVNPTTNSGNNVPGAPTRTGNVPAVYNPGRSGSVPAPRPGNGNNTAAQTTVDELINSGLFTNNGGGTAYASLGSMYTRAPHIFGPRQVESITIKGVEFRPVNGNGRVVTLEAPDGRIVDLPIENLNSQKVKYTINYGPRRMFVRTPPNSRYYAFGKVADPAFTTTPWFVNNPTSVWMPQTSWQTTYRPWIYGGAALTGGYFGGRKLGFWGGDDDEDSEKSIYEQLEENYKNGTSDGTLFDNNVTDDTPRDKNPELTITVDDSLDPQNIQDNTGGTVLLPSSQVISSDTLGYTSDPNAAAEFDIMMQIAQQEVKLDPNSDFSKRYKQMMAEGKSDNEIISYITSWWNSVGKSLYTVPVQL